MFDINIIRGGLTP